MDQATQLEHRGNTPPVTHQRPGSNHTWTLTRSEFTRALNIGPSLVDRLASAGLFTKGHTAFAQIQWMLNAHHITCQRQLPLAQTPAQHLADAQNLDDATWASQYTGPWPNRGFPYDEISTGKILAIGTGTFITGALRITHIEPTPDSTLTLTAHTIARLHPPGPDQTTPTINTDPNEPPTTQQWLKELIGHRYTPRRGGSISLI